MPVRKSEALWHGNLLDGKGTMTVGDGVFEGPFTHASRFKEGDGTNPEELLGAAHAGCFSMFLASLLSKAGHVPDHVHTVANVHIGPVDGAPTIHTIELVCRASVPGIDQEQLNEYAEQAKAGCPVSKAVAAVSTITLSATLE